MTLLDRETVARRLTDLALSPGPHAYPLIAWADPQVGSTVRSSLLEGGRGVRVQSGVGAPAALGASGGVALLTPDDLRALRVQDEGWREGQVWCVLGEPDTDSVAWVERAAGRPSLVVAAESLRDVETRGEPWEALAQTLAEAGAHPAQEHNPVVIAARPEQMGALEAECALRLEAAGTPRVRTIPQPEGVVRAALAGVAPGQAVIVRADAGWSSQASLEEAIETLGEWVRQAIQVVILADGRLGHDIEDDPDWAPVRLRATFLDLQQDTAGDGGVSAAEGAMWPHLEDILPGAPDLIESTAVSARGQITAPGEGGGGTTVLSLIPYASAMALTGELVLYDRHRFGSLRFYQGSLVGAKIQDGLWPLANVAGGGTEQERRTRLVLDRAARMAMWPAGTHWLLRNDLGDPLTNDTPRLAQHAVVINIARWLDEVQEFQRNLGGWSRRWTALPDPLTPAPEGSDLARLWELGDGRRSLLQMAADAGLFLPDAYRAIAEGQQMGLFRAGSDDPQAKLDVTHLYAVVDALLARGLVAECAEMLEHHEMEAPLPVWAARVYGYLIAARDPIGAIGVWSTLGSRGSDDERDALDSQQEIETLLARRLVEARQPNSNAVTTFRAARRDMEARNGEFQWSPRLAAAVGELALRARDLSSFEAALAWLRRWPEGERRGLLGPLLTAARAMGVRLSHD